MVSHNSMRHGIANLELETKSPLITSLHPASRYCRACDFVDVDDVPNLRAIFSSSSFAPPIFPAVGRTVAAVGLATPTKPPHQPFVFPNWGYALVEERLLDRESMGE